jgi:hypothetical protein
MAEVQKKNTPKIVVKKVGWCYIRCRSL